MKHLLLITTLFLASSMGAQAADEKHLPEKAMDSAVPKMKNPEGTEGLHPPQKAMDQAVEPQKASSPQAGTAAPSVPQAKFPDWDQRVAGQTLELK